MQTSLRISVVIPALDEQDVIGACLESLARQDWYGDLEVIVVDNGSTDATAQIAREAGAVVLHEPRRGVCHARQRGTEAATGDVVVSTDANTTFEPTWLSQIADVMTSRPDVAATCGPCSFVDAPWWGKPYTRTLFGVVDVVHRCTRRVIYASATNIAFRRTAWSGYDTRLTQGGDELGLLRSLRSRGAMHFDNRRVTRTSSRRLERGLFYNVFVTCLFFYLCAYSLNRLTGRTLVGSAPNIRPGTIMVAHARRPRILGFAGPLLVALALAWWWTPVDVV